LAPAIVAAAVLSPASGYAATPDTPYDVVRVPAPEPQDQGRFGERSAPAGDIDGDGVTDIFISAFQQDVGEASQAGRVYLLSGRTREVIYAINSPEPQANERFGFFMSVPGDLDGDKKDDIVVAADLRDIFRNEAEPGDPDPGPCGAPEPNGCYENEGAAFAYSGATGQLLYGLVNPQPQSNDDSRFGQVFGFGVGLGSAGDINGDARADVLVGAASNDVPRDCNKTGASPCRVDQGQVFVFDGRSGQLLRTYDLPDPEPAECNTAPGGPGATSCGFLGFAVQGVGDVDGDGVSDHLLDAGTYDGRRGRMYLFSGRLGTLIRRIDSPFDGTRIFGLQDVAPGAPGDLNGDGVAEIYGNSFQEPGPDGSNEGRAFVFDGSSGDLLYTLRDPTPAEGGSFGYSMTNTDYDRDGTPDLFVGQNGSERELGGGSYIFDGASGSLLKAFELPAEDREEQRTLPPPGPRFGRTVSAPGDLNADGEPDYVVGAPQIDVGSNANQGRVYVFLSRVPPAQPPAPPAPPAPQQTEAQGAERGYPPIDRFRGTSVWSVREDGRYFLVADRGGSVERPGIAPRGVPFDVDLGPDEDGDVVAAYSRCDKEPELPDLMSRLYAAPVAAYATGRGCDIYRYDFASGEETKLPGASTDQASEFLPSVWRDDVAFGRVYEQREGRRGIYPYLYVRPLEGGRSARQPGGSRGLTGLPGPTSVDLYGRRLSFVWNYARQDRDKGTQTDDEGTTQVRLDTVGGDHRVVSDADFGAGTYASYLSPKGSNGRITYGFQRVANLESEDGPRSISSILLRYKISNADKSVANPPGTVLGSSAVDAQQLLVQVPERFGPAPLGQILRADDVTFVD
jgi:hypothetical protein